MTMKWTSVESLTLPVRCGARPKARQMRQIGQPDQALLGITAAILADCEIANVRELAMARFDTPDAAQARMMRARSARPWAVERRRSQPCKTARSGSGTVIATARGLGMAASGIPAPDHFTIGYQIRYYEFSTHPSRLRSRRRCRLRRLHQAERDQHGAVARDSMRMRRAVCAAVGHHSGAGGRRWSTSCWSIR